MIGLHGNLHQVNELHQDLLLLPIRTPLSCPLGHDMAIPGNGSRKELMGGQPG